MNIGIDFNDVMTNTSEYLKNNNISYSNLPEEWKKREFDFAKKYMV